jgi:hypothetical protein
MRAPRSLLLILGGTALVAGAVLAFATYSDGAIPCERPVDGAFHRGGRPGLQIDLDRGVTDVVPCPTSARWRLGGGVVLMVVGAVALVVWSRQSRLGREPDAPPAGGSPP